MIRRARRRATALDELIPGFSDLTEIGRGASGVVYRARQDRLDRAVALKVLDVGPDDREARRRFERELEITVRLGAHPSIVQVLDAGQTRDGRPYLAMELYDQGSVADRVARHGPLSPAEASALGSPVADALATAHAAGILHRDVKPQNILLSPFGPALADFGIARISTQLDRTDSLDHFTPWHAAPEVLAGQAPTERSDLYSLASTLFTVVTGRPPFAGPSGESLLSFERRVLTAPIPRLPDGDGTALLQAILDDALARDPADRPATAADLATALRAAAGDARAPLATTPPSPAASSLPVAELGRTHAPRASTGPAPPATGENGTGSDAFDPERTSHVPARRSPVELIEVPPRAKDTRRRIALGLLGGVIAAVALILILTALSNDGDDAGPSTTTAAETVTTFQPGTPGEPVGFQVEASGDEARLTWTDTSDGKYRPVVIIAPSGGQQKVVPLGLGTEEYLATGLNPGVGYCFQVQMLFTYDASKIGQVKSEVECIRGAEALDSGLDESGTTTPTTG